MLGLELATVRISIGKEVYFTKWAENYLLATLDSILLMILDKSMNEQPKHYIPQDCRREITLSTPYIKLKRKDIEIYKNYVVGH